MDFVFDELANGRSVKALTVVDGCSKEVVRIAADTSIPAPYVARVLDQVSGEGGAAKNHPHRQRAGVRSRVMQT